MTYMPNRYSHASAGKAREPHAGEITALVHELKRRKLALEGKVRGGCKDGCTDCAPCTKGWHDPIDCEGLLREISAGNRSKWNAWADLDRAVAVAQAKSKRLAQIDRTNLTLELLGNLTSLAMELNVVSRILRVRKIASASSYQKVGRLVGDTLSVIFELAKQSFSAEGEELLSQVEILAIRIPALRETAEYLEDAFWKQVRSYEELKCPATLMPQHFNRP